MAESSGLENRRRATVRGFESHPLRHTKQAPSRAPFLYGGGGGFDSTHRFDKPAQGAGAGRRRVRWRPEGVSSRRLRITEVKPKNVLQGGPEGVSGAAANQSHLTHGSVTPALRPTGRLFCMAEGVELIQPIGSTSRPKGLGTGSRLKGTGLAVPVRGLIATWTSNPVAGMACSYKSTFPRSSCRSRPSQRRAVFSGIDTRARLLSTLRPISRSSLQPVPVPAALRRSSPSLAGPVPT